ncbi:hypothetical protein RBH94_06005 [Aestuariibaculum sp. YM273]|uniref:hypothetical protein n=1 Tax=Aestuariibaculum sp. YM273 TaxID=3070659 RepID=UPI0027DD932A|nr:hypothetical protein [Aestuariibaculum sp. YM273]WMI66714.1 hypothetical protein RBH94_06005 [Aestuariibaculum sp. YM273]
MSSIDKKYQIVEGSSFSSSSFEEDYITPSDSFLFAISKKDEVNLVHGELCSYTEGIFEIMQEFQEREKFYVKAIQNLKKQKEYVNLLYQVSNELISDEEFSTELEENESKYLIKLDNKLNAKNFFTISKIMNRIGDVLLDDDLSEIFSLKSENFEKILLKAKSNNE